MITKSEAIITFGEGSKINEIRAAHKGLADILGERGKVYTRVRGVFDAEDGGEPIFGDLDVVSFGERQRTVFTVKADGKAVAVTAHSISSAVVRGVV